MKLTIYDVAKRAGVSIATVSKVVNNKGKISESTRKRVLQIMKEMDYHPSSVAAALTSKKTNTIGLLVPDISDPFFAKIARSLENSAWDSDYSILIGSTDHKAEREKEYLDRMIKKQVDGVILATEPLNKSAYEKLISQNIPHLLFFTDHPTFSTHIVTTDDIRGGYLAGQYLLEKGHKDIGIICGNQGISSKNRLEGFKKAMGEAGVTLGEEYMIPVGSNLEEVRTAVTGFFQMEHRPTGVFATTDLITTAILYEARKYNIAIPDDLSVIGYDDNLYTLLANPDITSISQPFEELSRYAVSKLIESIDQPGLTESRMMLSPTLTERNSVKDMIHRDKIK